MNKHLVASKSLDYKIDIKQCSIGATHQLFTLLARIPNPFNRQSDTIQTAHYIVPNQLCTVALAELLNPARPLPPQSGMDTLNYAYFHQGVIRSSWDAVREDTQNYASYQPVKCSFLPPPHYDQEDNRINPTLVFNIKTLKNIYDEWCIPESLVFSTDSLLCTDDSPDADMITMDTSCFTREMLEQLIAPFPFLNIQWDNTEFAITVHISEELKPKVIAAYKEHLETATVQVMTTCADIIFHTLVWPIIQPAYVFET